MIQENIARGQRIEEFSLEAFMDEEWVEIAASSTVGYKKLLKFPRTRTDMIRLNILKARDNAMITEIGLYLEPDSLLP